MDEPTSDEKCEQLKAEWMRLHPEDAGLRPASREELHQAWVQHKRTLGIEEARGQLGGVVSAGEPVVITRNGTPVALISPFPGQKSGLAYVRVSNEGELPYDITGDTTGFTVGKDYVLLRGVLNVASGASHSVLVHATASRDRRTLSLSPVPGLLIELSGVFSDYRITRHETSELTWEADFTEAEVTHGWDWE